MTEPKQDELAGTEEAPKEARAAGRGGFALLAANVYFILTGLVQQALLPRAIGLADYGALSRVLAVSNVPNNVLVTTSIQGVSRTVAGAGDTREEAFRATLRVHLVLAVLAVTLLAIATPIIGKLTFAPDTVAPLFVMAGVLAIYGVYAPLIGYLNGRGMFPKQAALNVIAATLRTGGFLGIGWLFVKKAGPLAASLHTSPGVLGASIGAVTAAVGVFLVALKWTGAGRGASAPMPGVPDAKTYAMLVVPVMIAQLFTNGLMQADITLLGRYVSREAVIAVAADPQKAANEWVAVYRACQLFAFLPYQMLFSVTQVLFPMLAKAKKEEGDARVAELVSRGSRIGAIICGMLVVVILVLPGSLINFAYGAEVAARGAPTLRMLAIGQAAFAMLGLATTILVSLGRERDAMVVNGIALGALGLACIAMVGGAPFGEAQLLASARGVTVALALALVVGGLRARSIAGVFIPWKTALRVAAVIVLAYFAGAYVPRFGKLVTPLVAGVVCVGYLVALVVTGEIGKSDLSLVLSVVARRAKR